MAGGSFGIKNPNNMYVAMMRSRTIEDAMLKVSASCGNVSRNIGLMLARRSKSIQPWMASARMA
jgi:hypothetical protein